MALWHWLLTFEICLALHCFHFLADCSGAFGFTDCFHFPCSCCHLDSLTVVVVITPSHGLRDSSLPLPGMASFLGENVRGAAQRRRRFDSFNVFLCIMDFKTCLDWALWELAWGSWMSNASVCCWVQISKWYDIGARQDPQPLYPLYILTYATIHWQIIAYFDIYIN